MFAEFPNRRKGHRIPHTGTSLALAVGLGEPVGDTQQDVRPEMHRQRQYLWSHEDTVSVTTNVWLTPTREDLPLASIQFTLSILYSLF